MGVCILDFFGSCILFLDYSLASWHLGFLVLFRKISLIQGIHTCQKMRTLVPNPGLPANDLNMKKSLISLLFLLFISVFTQAQSPAGKYILVKDSDGKSPKGGAEISMTFTPGKFSLKAAMPGQTVTDNGTWKITGSTMTIAFKEMEQGTKTGAWSLANGTLTLPFMMLSNGKGSSVWQQAGTA